MKVTVEQALEKANEMAYSDYHIHAGTERKAVAKEWEKGDLHRNYIKIYCYTLNGRYKGSYSCGYVDMVSGEYVYTSKDEVNLFTSKREETTMKKIINGKVYDTSTAKEIGSWDNGRYDDNINLIEKTLYRKRTGEFFLYERGGANTQYAKQTGANHWSGGEYITPIELDEARKWAEENLTAEEYEAIWKPEDEGKDVLCLRLSPAVAAKLRELAVKEGRPINVVAEEMIAARIDS